MMNFYSVEGCYGGTHVVRVTLQDGMHAGHIAYTMGGNCFGAAIVCRNPFETDNQDNIALYEANDCDLAFDEEDESYTGTLHAPDGSTLSFRWSESEISDRVVSSEIINFHPE